MSTHEARQDKKGTNDFGEVPVEKQKQLSKERMENDKSEKTNEDLAAEEARKLDEKRAHPENFNLS